MRFSTAVCVAAVCALATVQAGPCTPPQIGNAANTAITTGVSLTNSGFSNFVGSVALAGGTAAGNGVSIDVGLAPLTLFGGKIAAGTGALQVDSANVGVTGGTDGPAGRAWLSLQSAATLINTLSDSTDLTGIVLNGIVLPPGVYSWSAALSTLPSDVITLSGAGLYIFKVNGAITTAALNKISLINGATANCVWWSSLAAITLGSGGQFAGNYLAAAGVTVGAGTTIDGAIYAKIGSVTLSADTINAPLTGCTTQTCPVVVPTMQFVPVYLGQKATDGNTNSAGTTTTTNAAAATTSGALSTAASTIAGMFATVTAVAALAYGM
jgi:hypothetical protein